MIQRKFETGRLESIYGTPYYGFKITFGHYMRDWEIEDLKVDRLARDEAERLKRIKITEGRNKVTLHGEA